MSLLSERHLMTVVINMHKPYFIFKTYVMSVLCTPLQVKCDQTFYLTIQTFFLQLWVYISQFWLFFSKSQNLLFCLHLTFFSQNGYKQLAIVSYKVWIARYKCAILRKIAIATNLTIEKKKKTTETWHKIFNSVVKSSFNCYFTSHHANVVT